MDDQRGNGRKSLFNCLIGTIAGLVLSFFIFGGLLYLFFLT